MPGTPGPEPVHDPGLSGGSSGPLSGIRVVELAGLGPAPMAALMLAELGADVVRVDRPSGAEGGLGDLSGLSRSRPSSCVDLKHPAGRGVVLRLLTDADVLVEGFRPGVTERLGLGPEVCLAANPRLVYARMTGWGQNGPLADSAGHDITYAAVSGALHLVGPPERPIPPANLLADLGGGAMYLLVGILAALQARMRTGAGQIVDAAMVDGAASLVSMLYAMVGAGHWRDERGVNLLDGGSPFYDTYACADGRFVAVGALEAPFYAELLAGLGVSHPAGQWDRLAWPALRATLAARFAERDRDTWVEVFAGSDACVAPVLSLTEAPSHPHHVARGTFVDLDGIPTPRVAPRFSATPAGPPGVAPVPGADTAAYLLAHGFSADEVRGLLAEGAIEQTT